MLAVINFRHVFGKTLGVREWQLDIRQSNIQGPHPIAIFSHFNAL